MLRSENVATPLTALRLSVPASAPPPGLVPIATVMRVVALVTVLPKASWTATWTAGLIAAPAVDGLGCPVNASWTGGPGVIGNPALVAPATPLAAAVRSEERRGSGPRR